MKLISLYLVFFALLISLLCLGVMLVSCGTPKAEETTADTTQTATGETTEETTEETTAETEPPVPTLMANPFEENDFVQNGHFLSCTAQETAICIDVSKWQGNINWKKIKAAGVDYAIIRAGFRGTARSGTLNTDLNVVQNYEGAKQAGIKVGFYFFSQARDEKEAREEAEYLIGIVRDWEVDLPLVCDWEYFNEKETPRVHGMTQRQVTDCIRAFCETVEAAGYEAMFYCSRTAAEKRLYVTELADFAVWYADYTDRLDFAYRPDIWQYSDTGRVPGIYGNVNMNIIFLQDSVFSPQ